MAIEEILEICQNWKGVTKDIKWDDHLCLSIGDKMFAVFSPDLYPPTASIKVTEEEFESLSQKDGIRPSPYLARYNWIYLDDISLFSKNDWTHFLKQSYLLTYEKLPKNMKLEIQSAG